jgi:hypothetical protein
VLEDEGSFLDGSARACSCSMLRSKPSRNSCPVLVLATNTLRPVRLVAHPPQIAERAERIQGARDHRL